MTRRPHLSVTPHGLAYVSGDYCDRRSAIDAGDALRTIWENVDDLGHAAALKAERAIHQARAEQIADTIMRSQT